QAVAHTPSQESPALAPASPALAETAPTKAAPASPQGLTAGSEKPITAKSPEQSEAAKAPPAQGDAHAVKSLAKPLVYQTKWRRLDPGEVAMPRKIASPAETKESAGAPKPDALATASTGPRTFLRVIPSPKLEAPNSSGTSIAKAEAAPPPKQPAPPPPP